MKTKLYFFITLFFLITITSPLQAAQVKVWHEYHKNTPSAVKAEGILKASPEAIWKTLIRFNDYADFMPRITESFFITPEGIEALKKSKTKNAQKIKKIAQKFKTMYPRKKGKTWNAYVFMVLNTPFPVANRWYILHTVNDETKAQEQKYKRCWKLVIGNIDNAQGCWYLEPTPQPSNTLARYQDSVNPGGHVPQWAAKMGATRTVPKMFKNLEKEVRRSQTN